MIMTLLAFLAVAAVLICTPGPDTVLVVRNTLVGGRRGGILTAIGVAGGQLVWTVAAALGLAALLQASQLIFTVVKVAGAAYLIYLGIRSLISAWRRPPEPAITGTPVRPSRPAGLRQGLISNLANPKMVAFYLSLLPQFVPAGWNPLVALITLGATFSLLTLAWLSLYAVVLDRGRTMITRPSVRKIIDGVAGALLVALGIRLALQARP